MKREQVKEMAKLAVELNLTVRHIEEIAANMASETGDELGDVFMAIMDEIRESF